MSVSATFQPDQITAASGETATLSLHLQNNSDTERMVTLRPAGPLAQQTVLQSETIFLDPNEGFDVTVIIDANASLAAGKHECAIEVINDKDTVHVTADIQMNATAAWSARIEPSRSKSSSTGRHKIAVTNDGNVPVMVELIPKTTAEVVTEIAAPAVNVDPGKTAKVELRMGPHSRFWSGDTIDHPFSVEVKGNDESTTTLEGIYEQTPRVRPWFAPALAGMLGALLVGTLAWFALLKPSVENIAQDEATKLDQVQDTSIDERVAEMEAAAIEASELPLGQPADVQLSVSGSAAQSTTAGQIFSQEGAGRRLSVTDVIFQNPTGAVGRLQLVRQAGSEPADDDDVLLDQEMANFRDLDFHLVAPFSFESGQTIVLRMVCETPGPGTNACEASATIVGFVDEV